MIYFYIFMVFLTCEILVANRELMQSDKRYGIYKSTAAFLLTLCCLFWPALWVGAVYCIVKGKV